MRSSHPLATILILLSFASGTQSRAASCDSFREGTLADAIRYIENAASTTAGDTCVDEAIKRIQQLPPAEQIPILIDLLPYKPSDGPPHFPVASTSIWFPQFRFPAVLALLKLSPAIDAPLLNYIADNPHRNQIAWENAVFVYMMSRTQQATPSPEIIKSLKQIRSEEPSASRRGYLTQAMQYIADHWCGDPQNTKACRNEAY